MKIVSSFPGVYRSHFLGEKILIASSGRQYSKDKRDQFLGALSLDPSRTFFVTQVHGNEIVEVDEKTSDTSSLQADGLITSVPGFGIGIRTADCLPVFFASSDQTVIGLAHAGWRGLHQGILEKMVKLFRGSYFIEAATIRILIGPAIRSCCYEVGEEFCGYFPETCASSTGSKPKMDLVRE
ncbi:MAG: laccase domain-containing protein, partial [Candidatus Omnitrophica bacterium]|nr:laccase domain-containing protein [Candidatus Omnitrophota bacterium]